MRILLDTNRLTDLLRGEPAIVRLVEQADEVWLPYVVMAEIKAGFLGGTRLSQNMALLAAFMATGVTVLYADEQTLEAYARLFVQLKSAGTPIPDNDLWIGALAVQHGLILVTRDAHFKKIPQLQLN
ncbi:MAG: type II toxin-antitoxin system VapC family toxin [Acidobacteria bacterium]|nr:type II toxin-antitoxin system VapC family toxin [Acidobacteriota bacterium]